MTDGSTAGAFVDAREPGTGCGCVCGEGTTLAGAAGDGEFESGCGPAMTELASAMGLVMK
jgi:hypothetical protein